MNTLRKIPRAERALIVASLMICAGLTLFGLMGATMLTVAHRNAINIQTDLHCTPDDLSDDKQTANLTAINAALASATRYDSIIIPSKKFYVNGIIVTPAKVNGPVIIGESGLSYRLGNEDIGGGGIGLPGATIVNTVGSATILRLGGWGTTVTHVTLQGRRIPTNAGSATGTRCGYGIEVLGNDPPHTGGHTFDTVAIVECDTPFHASASPNELHADFCRVENCVFHGCTRVYRSDNQQAVGWVFHHNDLLGDAAGCLVFDVYRGQVPHCTDLLIDCPKVTLIKHGYYSPNNDDGVIDVVRYDSPAGHDGRLTIEDYSAAENYGFHDKITNLLICAVAAAPGGPTCTEFNDYDPSQLIIAHAGGNGDRDLNLVVEPIYGQFTPEISSAGGLGVTPTALDKYRPIPPINRLPTSDPHRIYQWYLSSGALRQSAG